MRLASVSVFKLLLNSVTKEKGGNERFPGS